MTDMEDRLTAALYRTTCPETVELGEYHLGMVYFKLGNKDEARKSLLIATNGDYSYTGYAEAKETLDAL